MNRLLITSILLSISSLAFAAGDLTIKAGKTYLVGPDQASLDLENFVIESNARIRLDPSVTTWKVNAENAKIGFGVVIDGAGRDGASGRNGTSSADASVCRNGSAGSNGNSGRSGGDAQNVRWSLGINEFGSVRVSLTGGRGGEGGNGGDGQNIPNFSNCSAAGGRAGDGGQGGDGGDGGSFRFHYWFTSDQVIDLTNSIAVKILGGAAGKGGLPGLPGVGSSGYYANQKSLSGSRQWVQGGGDGAEGGKGVSGLSGQSGGLDIRRVSKDAEGEVVELPAQPVLVEEPVITGSTEDRLQQLEIQIQKLEARIKLLELDKL